MNLDRVIQQLRSYAPSFEERVFGAAEWARAKDGVAPAGWPVAYVIPNGEDAGENGNANSLRQVVTERVGIVVGFDNSSDRRGQCASAQYDVMRTEVWATLLNWRLDPVRAPRGLEFAGGELLAEDRARLFYQWDFTQALVITDRDGWQIRPDPLVEIDLSIVRADTGQVLAGVVLHLPPAT